MATRDELYQALRNADAAGDAEGARRLAHYIQSMPADEPAKRGGVLQQVGNAAAGLVRGAGSIGATLLAPIDIASDALAGRGLTLQSNRERRASMDAALETMGAQPDSLAYQGGKLVSEIAGTAGVGGVAAKGCLLYTS
nr:hypothetical protein [Mycobacterium sp.]